MSENTQITFISTHGVSCLGLFLSHFKCLLSTHPRGTFSSKQTHLAQVTSTISIALWLLWNFLLSFLGTFLIFSRRPNAFTLCFLTFFVWLHLIISHICEVLQRGPRSTTFYYVGLSHLNQNVDITMIQPNRHGDGTSSQSLTSFVQCSHLNHNTLL